MANDLKFATTTQVTHVSSGASVAAGAMSLSTDISGTVSSTQTASFPMADVVLTGTFGASVSSASNFVVLYRRDLNIDGTADAPIPGTAAPAYSSRAIGHFSIPPFTASSGGSFIAAEVPISHGDQEFYIENKTNATLNAGWTVKVLPKTYNGT